MIISVANSKGGVGKSTTTATLARLWAKERPVVLDTDRNLTAHRFKLPGVEVMKCPPDEVCDRLKSLAGRFILIDCPGDAKQSKQALRAGHLIILPTSPDAVELDASLPLLTDWNEYRPTRLLFTRCVPADKPVIDKARRKYGALIFKTQISQSRILKDAARKNLTILDYAPNNIAARQYVRLGQEIMSYYANQTEAD